MLLAESDHLRQQFASETVQIKAAAAWVDTTYTLAHSLRAFWPLAAAGAGFFVARKSGSWLRLIGKAWSLWRIAKKIEPLWRRFSSAHNPAQ